MKKRENKYQKELKNWKREVKKGRRTGMGRRKSYSRLNRKKNYTKFGMKIGSKKTTINSRENGK